MDLEKIRQDYVSVYGENRPCCFLHYKPKPELFLGVKNDGHEVCFLFTHLGSVAFHILEMQFRNRLSRKISFTCSDTSFSIQLNNFYEEELEEVARTIEDLNNFFSGRQMSFRLKVEVFLHRKKLDWRDQTLIAQKMA